MASGEKLAHYRLLEKLGEGGMGVVYLAEDCKLGREVALKLLPEPYVHDAERLARFAREARAVAALNHPNIVTIYSVEEENGRHFLTMEHVRGTTLAAVIAGRGLPLAELLDTAVVLADAVGAAHARGVIHRDLKPANLMINERGELKVLDFGLAKLREPAPDSLSEATTRTPTTSMVTGPGPVLGTIGYLSPEQAEGRPLDPRSDVFSLGVILYEMATGVRPFRGNSNLSIVASILKDNPPSIRQLRKELPEELSGIVQRCLAKFPEERFRDAAELCAELKALRRGRRGKSSPVGASPLARWPVRLALLASVVALSLLAVFLGVRIFESDRSGPRSEGTPISSGNPAIDAHPIPPPLPSSHPPSSGRVPPPAEGNPAERKSVPSARPAANGKTAAQASLDDTDTVARSAPDSPREKRGSPSATKEITPPEPPPVSKHGSAPSAAASESIEAKEDSPGASVLSGAPMTLASGPADAPPPPAAPLPPPGSGAAVTSGHAAPPGRMVEALVSARHGLDKPCEPGDREAAKFRHGGHYCTEVYRLCLRSRPLTELAPEDKVIVDLVHRMNALPCPPDYEEVSWTRHAGKQCTDTVRLCAKTAPAGQLADRPVLEDALFAVDSACPYRYVERSIDRHRGKYGRELIRVCVLYAGGAPASGAAPAEKP